MLKWLKRMLSPGAREVSPEEMQDTINDMQKHHGIPEDQVPWEEMRDDIGPEGDDHGADN